MPSSAALCGDALGIQEVCDLLWGFSGSAMSVDECDRCLLQFALTGVAYLLGHGDTRMVMQNYGHMVNRPDLPKMRI